MQGSLIMLCPIFYILSSGGQVVSKLLNSAEMKQIQNSGKRQLYKIYRCLLSIKQKFAIESNFLYCYLLAKVKCLSLKLNIFGVSDLNCPTFSSSLIKRCPLFSKLFHPFNICTTYEGESFNTSIKISTVNISQNLTK